MKREEMIKRYEDIVLNIHGKAGDEERADYILALCRITQLICQLYQPEQDTKWQKLKEILKRQIDTDSREFLETGFTVFKNYITAENLILDIMQELEAEDEK